MISSSRQAPWKKIGDLEWLLRPEGPLELLRSSGLPVTRAAMDYIRLKPGTGALLGLTLDVEDAEGETIRVRAAIRTHEKERARVLAAKWTAMATDPGVLGPGVHLLSGERSVLFVFPNDTRLRGLRFVTDPHKLKRLLVRLPELEGWRIRGRKTRLEIVRYKPERRLVAKARLSLIDDTRGLSEQRSVFLRFFPDARGERIATLVRGLHAATPDLRRHLPLPLGSLMDGRLYAEECLPGEEAYQEACSGGVPAEAFASILASLHEARLPDLADLPVYRHGERLEEVLAALALLDPDLAAKAREAGSRAAAGLPAQPPGTLVHGDCHLHQFLLDGGNLALVDFERSGRGHALQDLGQLTAHVVASEAREPRCGTHAREVAEAIVADYARRRPDVDLSALAAFQTAALLERALLPFRRQEPDWLERCHVLVDLALETMARRAGERGTTTFFQETAGSGKGVPPGFAWDVFHPRPGRIWPGRVKAADGTRIFGIYDTHRDAFEALRPEDDARLPDIGRWLEGATLLSYRPGRRATLKREHAGKISFVKLVRRRKIPEMLQRLALAREAGEKSASEVFPRIPALLGVERERGELHFAPLEGPSLHHRLATRKHVARDLERVGRSLAAFHQPSFAAGTLPARKPRPAEAWLSFLEAHDPAHARDARAVLKDLPPLGPAEAKGPRDRLIHGDLHDRNLILGEERIGLLDLDMLSIGQPAEDVGNLMAHLLLRALQRGANPAEGRDDGARLLEGYAASGGGAPPSTTLAFMAHALFRLACIYRFRRRWLHLCPRLLQLAARPEASGFP